MSDQLIATARERFAAVFGGAHAPRVVLAPGRINLIGEHTDYNDGFVLPVAIDRHIAIAFVPRTDGVIRAQASAFGETKEGIVSEFAPPGGTHWFSYVAGVAWALGQAHFPVAGADLVIHGDLPLGAGLSSSAALEMALARALGEVSCIPWVPEDMARLGQKAENLYVGVSCGLMDQFSAAVSQAGCALLLDCRSLEFEQVPVPDEAAIVVMDTGSRRALAGSAYNDRVACCEKAVRRLRSLDSSIRALRDVDSDLLALGRNRLDEATFRRVSHVVAENHRPVEMAAALRSGDLAAAGYLMDASHASLRDLYEVSSIELDMITDIARAHPACYGARMTGAGFGGCAVALVDRRDVEDFNATVHATYHARAQLPCEVFACRPSAGARIAV